METHKKAEFVVEAPDAWGIERGINLACQMIAKGDMSGRTTIPAHGVVVDWRVTDAVKSAPPPPPMVMQGPTAILPNISMMDIEEAKGVAGTAGSIEELDMLANIEKAGSRTPGGRKGVLDYIEKLVAEKAAIARGEAAVEPAAPPVPPPMPDPALQPVPVPSDIKPKSKGKK